MTNIEIQLTESNTFNTLAEAVAAVKPDLSYNERLAVQEIKELDKGCSHYTGTEKAIVNGKDIYRVYTTADGLRIVSKFQPFFSVMSDCPFQMVTLTEKVMKFTDSFVPKKMRNQVAAACKIVPEICFM